MDRCVCTGCDTHELCRVDPEQGNDMCMWCDIERTVERRWSEMLNEEATS